MRNPRFLGVLLCYNDGDFLRDAITHLLKNHHEIVVWNHGSTDETQSVLNEFRGDLRECTDISRDVDFYDIYPLMSKHLRNRYVNEYDWISWPDQDELLEGPFRDKPYWEYLQEAVDSDHNWIEFRDLLYWYTDQDDQTITSPSERIRHYSITRHGPPKIRSWRASSTNLRWFNHNASLGTRYSQTFNVRHYPIRSEAQLMRRIQRDRADLNRGEANWHYEKMKREPNVSRIVASSLHYDDGRGNLSSVPKFDWKSVFGKMPTLPKAVAESFSLSNKRWQIAEIVKKNIQSVLETNRADRYRSRLERWAQYLTDQTCDSVYITMEQGAVRIITSDIASAWVTDAAWGATHPSNCDSAVSVHTTLSNVPVWLYADCIRRAVVVDARIDSSSGRVSPLAILAPAYGGDTPRVMECNGEQEYCERLRATYYFLALETVQD